MGTSWLVRGCLGGDGILRGAGQSQHQAMRCNARVAFALGAGPPGYEAAPERTVRRLNLGGQSARLGLYGSGPEDGGEPSQNAPRGGRLNPVVVVDDRNADQHVARPVLDRQAQTRRNENRIAA